MTFWTLAGIAAGLSMDAMAVGIGVSVVLRGASPRQIFRLSFHFGLFQALMPIVGWYSGGLAAPLTASVSHWVVFLILSFIGGRAVWNAFCGAEGDAGAGRDPTRGKSLVLLSLATSMDAFAVGVSFAMLDIRVWYPALIIGCVTGSLTVLGMVFGGRIGLRFGKVMEIAGGIILILIGIKTLMDGLFP